MTITIEKAFEIFEIKNEKELMNMSAKEMKKKYHVLCLKHHPDKTKVSQYDFIDVKNSYEMLISLKKDLYSSSKETDSFKSRNSYDELWEMVDSLFTVNTLNKIMDYIENVSNTYFKTVNYTVGLSQVREKNVFFNDTYKVYIPLWHNVLRLKDVYDMFDMKCDTNIYVIFKISVHDLNQNVKILANNDIVVQYNEHMIENLVTTKDDKKYYKLSLCVNEDEHNVIYVDYDENLIRNRVKVYEAIGIPRMCKTNVYDTQEISNVILMVV